MKKTITIIAVLALCALTMDVLAGSSGVSNPVTKMTPAGSAHRDRAAEFGDDVVTSLDAIVSGTQALATLDVTGATDLNGAATTTNITIDTGGTIAGALATDEVLSSGYSSLVTGETVTKGGSFFCNTTAASGFTITLPDPATVLGKTIRIVLAIDGGDLVVDTDASTTHFVAGDGGTTDSRCTMETVLDQVNIQAISTNLWGVLDQTGSLVYTSR